MKFITKIITATATLALAFATAASAQSMRVNVPFSFRACGQTLPAGDYQVNMSQSQARLTFNQVDGKASCFLPVRAYNQKSGADAGSLLFSQYGNRYFLSHVNPPGANLSVATFPDRAERELAKAEPAPKSVVVRSASM
jgi:hypothetical protein